MGHGERCSRSASRAGLVYLSQEASTAQCQSPLGEVLLQKYCPAGGAKSSRLMLAPVMRMMGSPRLNPREEGTLGRYRKILVDPG